MAFLINIMQVVLQKDVKHLGRRGDVVVVKRGYYMNFLGPKGFAEFGTVGRIRVAKDRLAKRSEKLEEVQGKASELKERLEGMQFTVKAKTTGKDTLYSALHEDDVINVVKENAKIELTPASIKFAKQIKKVGEHTVKLHLAEDVDAEITLNVESDEK